MRRLRPVLRPVSRHRPTRWGRRIIAIGGSAAFSPSGRQIAYRPDYPYYGLWVVRPNCRRSRQAPRRRLLCHGARRITRSSSGSTHTSPSWSPAGRRIVFATAFYQEWGGPYTGGPGQIFTVRRDGRGRRFVTNGEEPDWSSRGEIAFVDRSKDGGIRVVDPKSRRVRVLTTAGVSPSWAPGGERIAFATAPDWEPREDAGLYVINADGTGLRRLWSPPASRHPYSPAWSPDGRTIAFISGPAAPDMAPSGTAYEIAPDGQNLRVLSSLRGTAPTELAWQPVQD